MKNIPLRRQGLLILLFSFFIVSSVFAQKINCVTEEDPPLNYTENGVVKGASTEIVEQALKKAGYEYTLTVYPWSRAYDIALKRADTLIFSIARTPERENLFKWVGDIIPEPNYLVKLKSRTDIIIQSLEDVKRYRVGVVRSDFREHYFRDKGFSSLTDQLQVTDNNSFNMKKLFLGRVDLVPVSDAAIVALSKEMNFDLLSLERGYTLDELPKGLYMAYSLNTADEVVEKTKQALEQIKIDGQHEEILQKYNIVKKDLWGAP